MTAYVHIGTPKTGTTTIQTFMAKNNEALKQKGFLYSTSIIAGWQHWRLSSWVNTELVEKKNEQQQKFCQEIKDLIKQEIKANQDKTFVFSTESLTWDVNLNISAPVFMLQKLLKELGFDEVKIILYCRNQADLMVSADSENIKMYHGLCAAKDLPSHHIKTPIMFDFQNIIQKYMEVFGRDNLIVKLFDKNEFLEGDLIKDFLQNLGLKLDNSFVIPPSQNETLDLIGFELGERLNTHFKNRAERNLYGLEMFRCSPHFQSKDKELKFMPKKDHYKAWNDYFEESNEWVRKEFFPHKERLFPKKDLSNYKENYELKEMKPEYWDRIAAFIVDFAKNRKKIIDDKDKLITTLTQQKQQLEQTNTDLQSQLSSKSQQLTQVKSQLTSKSQELESLKSQYDSKIKELQVNLKITQDSLSSLPIKKQTLEIKNLESDLKIKELKAKQIEKELGYSYNVLEELDLKKQELISVKQQLDSTKKQLESKNTGLKSNLNYLIFKGNLSYLSTMTSAKDRIHNHLSYKLGKAMIENSKSILGYIRMPYVLSYIKEQHNKEQKQYQEQIKKNPNLKLPKLESYKDYKEALKEKECFTYKLGEALMKADKTWYKGGYVKLWFEAKRLEREIM
ncbi:M protein repeat protein [Helicobacter pullorum MIT 98-5489]|uniref:M protein repeat protein n=1 Tax=Helicobacter pullorum MIT 98-5489 TaxID=537972 RepID=C5EYV9_9HELI|nr:hypothetical protein [Helicobacter pullorum]EEQ63074.1 M protein repeat protein [Helicobacter pullorum MIT 98-5489]